MTKDQHVLEGEVVVFATFLEPEETNDSGMVEPTHDLDFFENVGALFSRNEWKERRVREGRKGKSRTVVARKGRVGGRVRTETMYSDRKAIARNQNPSRRGQQKSIRLDVSRPEITVLLDRDKGREGRFG
jgi:hypothetical protein